MIKIMQGIFIIFFLFATLVKADEWYKQNKIFQTNLIGSAVIVGWGILNWDYGKRRPHTAKEGWFSADTKYAGVDKLGHFYATFLLTYYFTHRFISYNYKESDAIRYAALSSLFLNSVMEAGDSFSNYGFSYEDMLFNIAGSFVGYYLLKHPKVDDLIDIRIEYKSTEKIKRGESIDILIDYNGMKFLTAVKFEGLDTLKRTFLRYFEFQVGYYARKHDSINHRYPYVGIGFNFSSLFYPVSRKAAKILEFYQPPFGYLSWKDAR